jgi:hypothetical protein
MYKYTEQFISFFESNKIHMQWIEIRVKKDWFDIKTNRKEQNKF